MRYEMKVMILSVFFSVLCMLVFTYASSFTQKSVYVCQVGIYKEEANKNAKLQELKDMGIEGYCYQKENQYYVLSMISDNDDEVRKHASKVKGIIKTYVVSYDSEVQDLLENLERGNE